MAEFKSPTTPTYDPLSVAPPSIRGGTATQDALAAGLAGISDTALKIVGDIANRNQDLADWKWKTDYGAELSMRNEKEMTQYRLNIGQAAQDKENKRKALAENNFGSKLMSLNEVMLKNVDAKLAPYASGVTINTSTSPNNEMVSPADVPYPTNIPDPMAFDKVMALTREEVAIRNGAIMKEVLNYVPTEGETPLSFSERFQIATNFINQSEKDLGLGLMDTKDTTMWMRNGKIFYNPQAIMSTAEPELQALYKFAMNTGDGDLAKKIMLDAMDHARFMLSRKEQYAEYQLQPKGKDKNAAIAILQPVEHEIKRTVTKYILGEGYRKKDGTFVITKKSELQTLLDKNLPPDELQFQLEQLKARLSVATNSKLSDTVTSVVASDIPGWTENQRKDVDAAIALLNTNLPQDVLKRNLTIFQAQRGIEVLAEERKLITPVTRVLMDYAQNLVNLGMAGEKVTYLAPMLEGNDILNLINNHLNLGTTEGSLVRDFDYADRTKDYATVNNIQQSVYGAIDPTFQLFSGKITKDNPYAAKAQPPDALAGMLLAMRSTDLVKRDPVQLKVWIDFAEQYAKGISETFGVQNHTRTAQIKINKLLKTLEEAREEYESMLEAQREGK